VLHLPRDAPSALPAILDRSGPLHAATAVDGEPLQPGHIYGPVRERSPARGRSTVPVGRPRVRAPRGRIRISELGPLTSDELPVQPSGYGCPSCGGVLFQYATEPNPRFRCRVGLARSAESLLDEQAIALEGALWMALRALEEKSALGRRMAGSKNTGAVSGARFRELADEAEAAGATIRRLINRIGSTGLQEAAGPGEIR
jgi:predicted  nucleic acid-binding Zn-ribbon protein